MERAGATKSQLSEESGVSRQTIDAWLAGQLPMRDGPVKKAARALGIPFVALWGNAQLLGVDERTRLAQLESFVERMAALVREVKPEPAPVIKRARPTRRFGEPREKAAGGDNSSANDG
jgi:transcriptional regulator with XRE-family HTH domain